MENMEATVGFSGVRVVNGENQKMDPYSSPHMAVCQQVVTPNKQTPTDYHPHYYRGPPEKYR